MPQTLIEKIAQRFAVELEPGHVVRSGDFLSVRPLHVMTHDNTAAVIPKFRATGATRIHDPAQPVFALDHDIQNTSDENLAKYARIRQFADEQGVDFYPAGRGIGHQVMVEEGYVLPGSFVVGSDSHSNLYGALGALGTPVVRTDAAAIWATGRTWWQVPPIVRVTLTGRLRPGVVGKDVIIALCGVFNHDEVLNCCIEFAGPGVASLSVEERMTISNMTTEWGALAGVFPYDDRTRSYLLKRAEVLASREQGAASREQGAGSGQQGAGSSQGRAGVANSSPAKGGAGVANTSPAKGGAGVSPADGGAGTAGQRSTENSHPLPQSRIAPRHTDHPRLTRELIDHLERDMPVADADAEYAKELTLDLSAVVPFVCGPNTVKTIAPLPEIERRDVRIDKAYLMSCVNARLHDFSTAADAIRGHKVAPHVELYIAAASDEVEREARERGYWQDLLDAGAIALPPGCGACIGLGRGTLEAGEVGISATNRNFKGRMGSRDAQVYLASPAVVAASAVAGRIAGPESIKRHEGTEARRHAGRSDEVTQRRSDEASAPRPSGAGHHNTADSAGDAFERMRASATCRVNELRRRAAAVRIIPGFPERITGELLYLPADNLNTDGIYGKDYTYKEGMTPEQMAAVAMENYDPEFQQIARTGDILVGGYNFGTGSSREQAATALKHRGLQMVIAGSFSQTYKRNAFNNGYIVIECPDLVDALKQAFAQPAAQTIRTGWQAKVDFVRSEIVVSDEGTRGQSDVGGPATYTFAPLGEVAQELIVKGGLEAVIRDQLGGQSA